MCIGLFCLMNSLTCSNVCFVEALRFTKLVMTSSVNRDYFTSSIPYAVYSSFCLITLGRTPVQ